MEEPAFERLTNITVMSVDNLPGELPRDASADFGRQLMKSLMDDLLSGNETEMLEKATITSEGNLTQRFLYLENYIK